MKYIIFLDVDGVLNTFYTIDRITEGGKIIGIDDKLVESLAALCTYMSVDAIEDKPIIILTSTWKQGWERDKRDQDDVFADYLDEKLAKRGLVITDKVAGSCFDRGTEIKKFLIKHPECEGWVVLDDDIFEDFDEVIEQHLVHTVYHSEFGGFHEGRIRQAMGILLGELNEIQKGVS